MKKKEIILPKVFDKLEFIGLMTADLLLCKIQNELILVAIVLYQIVCL
jgi:hypothetical protein